MKRNMLSGLFRVLLVAAIGACLQSESFAQSPGENAPAYIQLRRNVLINADLWTEQPEILAANFGFEGIIGIPGLRSTDDLQLAIAAGAGVNGDLAQLNPVPSLRNLTSGAGSAGVLLAGFGDTPVLGDALPIEVSWPLLPGSVQPENIAITLNTGEVVTPVAAALNPNYDYNERHVIVVFGEFGNRLRCFAFRGQLRSLNWRSEGEPSDVQEEEVRAREDTSSVHAGVQGRGGADAA